MATLASLTAASNLDSSTFYAEQSSTAKKAGIALFDARFSRYLGEVADEAARIALSAAVTGHWVYQTDTSSFWALTGADYSTAGDWTEMGGGGGSEFADNVFRIQDNGDATKQVAFECSGISAGFTRTLTVPNENGTILTTAGNLVGLSSASTARSNLGLGTMATQAAGAVAITGGTLNNCVIGGTTPSAGTFTGVTINRGTLTDPATALAVNATWNDVSDTFRGVEITVTDTASASGSTPLRVMGGAAGTTALMSVDKTGRITATDLVLAAGSFSGTGVGIGAGFIYSGTGLAAGRTNGLLLSLNSKIQFFSGSFLDGTMDTVLERLAAGALGVTDGAGGWGSLRLGTTSDAIRVGTHSAIGAETVTGFITIKDSAGTDRKIAVVS